MSTARRSGRTLRTPSRGIACGPLRRQPGPLLRRRLASWSTTLFTTLIQVSIAGPLVCSFAILQASPAFGDTIRLKNGRKLQGEVIEDESDEDWLVLKIRAGRLRIRRSDIKERVSESRDATLLGVGTRLSRNGDHAEAVAALREALGEAESTAAPDRPAEPDKLDTIRRRLSWALARRGKALEGEGQLGAAVEDYAEARELVPGDSASATAIRRLEAGLARSREALDAASLLADTGKLDEAIVRVEALLKADPRFDGRADERLARWRALRADLRMQAAARVGVAMTPAELALVLADYRRAVALDSALLDRIGPRWGTTVCLLSLDPGEAGRRAARQDLPQVSAALPGTVHGRVASAILVEQGRRAGDKVALWKIAAGPDARPGDPTATRQKAVERMLRATSLKSSSESRRATLEAFASLETEHFVIRHRNPELGRRVAAVAEHWWATLLPGFERPRSRIESGRITITLTHGAGQRRNDLEILGTTRIQGPPGRPHPLTIHAGAEHPELVTAVMPHEITHALLAVALDSASLPRWFQEGIATLHEPPIKRLRYRRLLARAHALRRAVPVRQLVGDWRIRNGDEGMSYYAHSLALVQELVRRGGLDRLIKLGRRLSKEPSAAVLSAAYGLETLSDLDKAIASRARASGQGRQGDKR